MLECPGCGSKFWMVNNDIAGTVYLGPAKYPLKRYSCTFDGVNTVRVTN
jgi:Rieske Fe-S protein